MLCLAAAEMPFISWLSMYHMTLQGGGGEVLPYMGYIGICGPKGCGFLAVLVINRVSILADFGHFGHKYTIFLEVPPPLRDIKAAV